MLHFPDETKKVNLPGKIIETLISRIVSGEFVIGQRLPSEREMALSLGVSRPVVHAAIVEMDRMGLVTLRPRHGTLVNDYREHGSLALLQALFNNGDGDLDPALVTSLLQVRRLMGVEMAGLSALKRRRADLDMLDGLIDKMENENPQDKAELDFRFHHRIALASGNLIYPMILNSFKPLAVGLTRIFYEDPEVSKVVHTLQRLIVACMRKKDVSASKDAMSKLFVHGETVVNLLFQIKSGG